MSEPTTYALPDEPDGPVWDRHGDKWERTGEMLRAHGHEWTAWKHVASGNLGTWPAPLMRGPVTTIPPWKPEVGGVCKTAEQYAAMPEGSVVAANDCLPKTMNGSGNVRGLAGTPRTILRVGWES